TPITPARPVMVSGTKGMRTERESKMKVRRNLGLLLAAISILCGSAGAARADTFPPGSLIIPMDNCYQYAGTAQYARQEWNAGLPYGTAYTSATACVWIDNGTTPNSLGDPYDATCWAGAGYPASSTGIQHAFGALYLLAKNNIPVSVALRP